MTKQYAKIRLEYTDYLIELSDVQTLLNVMSKATKLSHKYDSKAGDYVTYRDGDVDLIVNLAKSSDINAPIYTRLVGE
jgi:hypothetical protein